MRIFALIAFASILLFLTACTPKIQLETPNVVVDHKIEVKMDERSRAIISSVEDEESK